MVAIIERNRDFKFLTNKELLERAKINSKKQGTTLSKALDLFVKQVAITGKINLMSEEELAKYEGKIYYLDYAEVRKAEDEEEMKTDASISEELEKRNLATTEEIAKAAQAHRNPETMTDPIPVGIFMDEAPISVKTGCYGELVPIFGFSVTSQRTDTAQKYLDYLWDETIPFDTMIAMY